MVLMTDSEKLSSLIRHVKMVENNCNIISRKTMELNPGFALDIAKRGRMHDLSKFEPLEFEHLWKGAKNFDVALLHHHCHNSHHPEHYKNGIYGMSELDIAEMVADTTARSQEFGTDIRRWLFDEDKAPKRYGYLGDKEIYATLDYYVSMVVNQTFSKI